MKTIAVFSKDESRLAYVSDDDYERLSQYRWGLSRCGSKTRPLYYARARVDGKNELMHHVIVGKIDGMVIDHLDGNGLNNQRENLEHVTQAENIQRLNFATSSLRYVNDILSGKKIKKKRRTPAVAYDLWKARMEQSADEPNKTTEN